MLKSGVLQDLIYKGVFCRQERVSSVLKSGALQDLIYKGTFQTEKGHFALRRPTIMIIDRGSRLQYEKGKYKI